MDKILCVFPSGRILDRTALGIEKIQAYAEEFPTIIYFYTS